MEFMEFPPRKRRGTLLRHVAILSSAALSLFAFHLADDEITGKAEVSDAYGFTVIFLVAGYYIDWLPELWGKCKGTSFDFLLMPAFYASIMSYLYFAFRSYFIQPAATGATVLIQLFVMICLLCRAE